MGAHMERRFLLVAPFKLSSLVLPSAHTCDVNKNADASRVLVCTGNIHLPPWRLLVDCPIHLRAWPVLNKMLSRSFQFTNGGPPGAFTRSRETL